MKGNLSSKKISGRTGRSGFHQIQDRPTVHAAVQSFVTSLCSNTKMPCWLWILIYNPLAWELLKQVSAAASKGVFGAYYRSRLFPFDAPRPSNSNLGPPPLEKQGEGRYTDGRNVVLYLSRTPKTAALEAGTNEAKPKIFIQKFELTLPDATVINLTNDLESKFPHLHYLLLDSEYLPDESPFVPNPYRATQFLAFLCHLRGISAVEYPSVRGNYKDNPIAVNMVMFGKSVEAATRMMSGRPYEFIADDY
jgi:hypothetical protein